MSKLALFRTAIRSSLAVRTTGSAAQARGFSTEPEQSQQPRGSFAQSQSPGSGSVYMRLYGVAKNTLRTDIVNLLEGCNITQDDVRVEYNNFAYLPKSMLVRFPSSQVVGQANRMITRKGRLYRIERVEQIHWDTLAPYEGKAVLLQGIPQTAIIPDLERFLSGCNYYDSSIQLFFRSGVPGKMAIVRFPSQYDAMNCFITKNKSYCLNNQVQVRVLQ